jgi:hypothetical protein
MQNMRGTVIDQAPSMSQQGTQRDQIRLWPERTFQKTITM